MTELTDIASVAPAIGLANLLGLPASGIIEGAPLPPGFHILYFHVFGPLADVGRDGHTVRDMSLPNADLPRRMFAGARMRFMQPLRIGEPVQRETRIVSTERKEGRSGALLFLKQTVTVSNAGGACVTEDQTIVYRGGEQAAPTAAPRAEHAAQHSRAFHPNEVALFRFSALSGNSHRIHYDLPYATGIEGYPALVVHGPLIALHLLTFAIELAGGTETVEAFEFRAVSPLFLGDEARLCATIAPGVIRLWAEKDAGSLCMTAEVRLR